LEETAATAASFEEQDDIHKEIEIVIDARHSCRNNARSSYIVCIGNKTHKLLKVETVSKRDDPSS